MDDCFNCAGIVIFSLGIFLLLGSYSKYQIKDEQEKTRIEQRRHQEIIDAIRESK